MGLTSGKIILENPIARHSYIRIQEHGTIVNYINNPSNTTFGFWDGGRNEIKINLARARWCRHKILAHNAMQRICTAARNEALFLA